MSTPFLITEIIMKKHNPKNNQKLTISLKSLSAMLDCHRTSVRRWLKDAGIKPIALGKGKNGAIRYKWNDIQDWLQSQDYID